MAHDATHYWQDRWAEGRTGWHQDRPTPLMLKHWPALDVAAGGPRDCRPAAAGC